MSFVPAKLSCDFPDPHPSAFHCGVVFCYLPVTALARKDKYQGNQNQGHFSKLNQSVYYRLFNLIPSIKTSCSSEVGYSISVVSSIQKQRILLVR